MLYDPKWMPAIIARDDLTEQETRALLRVRTALLDGTITSRQFKMDTCAATAPSCGTHGCIGGWMGLLTMEADGVKLRFVGRVLPDDLFDKYFSHFDEPKFEPLFMPKNVDDLQHFSWAYDTATPADGVKAIDNFLLGEADPWKDWSAE